MKKQKLKSEHKRIKKELEEKLTIAFNAIITDYGKVKKSKVIIEKFAKQLSKKVNPAVSKKVVILEPSVEPDKIKATKKAKVTLIEQ